MSALLLKLAEVATILGNISSYSIGHISHNDVIARRCIIASLLVTAVHNYSEAITPIRPVSMQKATFCQS